MFFSILAIIFFHKKGKCVNIPIHHETGPGQGAVFFDVNNDGKEDLYTVIGGMWEGEKWKNQLFIINNTTNNQNSWVKFRLRGNRTNRFGLGAKIKIKIKNTKKNKHDFRYYQIDNKGGFGSSPYLVHLGLTPEEKLVEANVLWPVSGKWQKYVDVKKEELNVLQEG